MELHASVIQYVLINLVINFYWVLVGTVNVIVKYVALEATCLSNQPLTLESFVLL